MTPNPQDLLAIAEKLAAGGVTSAPGYPSDAELRRAASCAYYAMFHILCRCCADSMAGENPTTPLAKEKWKQVYRALDHGQAKRICDAKPGMDKFPTEIKEFATLFVETQRQRHEADYNPNATLTQSEVQQSITETRRAIAKLGRVPAESQKLFAAHLLIRTKRP